jgi:hypothetical protein
VLVTPAAELEVARSAPEPASAVHEAASMSPKISPLARSRTVDFDKTNSKYATLD